MLGNTDKAKVTVTLLSSFDDIAVMHWMSFSVSYVCTHSVYIVTETSSLWDELYHKV